MVDAFRAGAATTTSAAASGRSGAGASSKDP